MQCKGASLWAGPTRVAQPTAGKLRREVRALKDGGASTGSGPGPGSQRTRRTQDGNVRQMPAERERGGEQRFLPC